MWKWVKDKIDAYKRKRYVAEGDRLLQEFESKDTISLREAKTLYDFVEYGKRQGYTAPNVPLKWSRDFYAVVEMLDGVFSTNPKLQELTEPQLRFIKNICNPEDWVSELFFSYGVWIKTSAPDFYQSLIFNADHYEGWVTRTDPYYCKEFFAHAADRPMRVPAFGVFEDDITTKDQGILTTNIHVFAAAESKDYQVAIAIRQLRNTFIAAYGEHLKYSSGFTIQVTPQSHAQKGAYIAWPVNGQLAAIDKPTNIIFSGWRHEESYLVLPPLTSQMSQFTTLTFKTTYIPFTRNGVAVVDERKKTTMLHKVNIYITNFAQE